MEEQGLSVGTLVGWALVAAGAFDIGIGFLVVGPRARDATQRRVIQAAMALSGVGMAVAGGLILSGVIAF